VYSNGGKVALYNALQMRIVMMSIDAKNTEVKI